MRLKVGDLVSDWPYGQPWPSYGIVIEIDDLSKITKVMWIPSGHSVWCNSFALSKIKKSDKIELFT